ncbi:MAG: uroporphyrin-III C-methyltransferase / precorrin-2 dehydrogenase / sirohydrochlorin ferrochelatase, partial [Frankiaceae bacterium]|nr:uroporphyrin-III C-methyltransferase / precorrin-2 dehydrogenase / sirohydrochlorin ferrochelatase [Frankiaceae bacterium]
MANVGRRLPLFLDLRDRRVVVVGAGTIGARRSARLRAAGAYVVVVAPVVNEAVDADEVHERPFAPDDLDGAWLALACTDVTEVNAAVATAARDRGIWCVRADDASESDAWFAAAAEVDDIDVAVSASGDPRRATAIRDGIARALRDGSLHARRTRPGEGRVVLVGGGPGDPGLLTLRGYRELLAADVVVVDRLAPTALLDELGDDVEVVDVGKDPRGAAASQDAINALLVDRARAGKTVVRLKGGDPFVLGRGSEEVAACVAAGVAVDVVPGVTSATAAATLAGVPLTERGTAQEFTVASGHVPPGDPRSTVDWQRLGRGDGTLVLLMAVANLGPIAAALVDAGRDPATPAAVIQWGTLPAQAVVEGRLDALAALAAQAGLGSPGIIVV